MAVAPINKKGQVDYSHITVAYAGTNMFDINDLGADGNNIIKGKKYKNSQFDTAYGYAKNIKKKFTKTKSNHKGAYNPKLSFTGHSLGGSLALTIGVKMKAPAVTFNGPVPANQMSKKEIKFLQTHPTMYQNYLNSSDFIGNYNNTYGLNEVMGDFQHIYNNDQILSHLLIMNNLLSKDIDVDKTFHSLISSPLSIFFGNPYAYLKNGKKINNPLSPYSMIISNHGVESWFNDKNIIRNANIKINVPKNQSTFENTSYQIDEALNNHLVAIVRQFGGAGTGNEGEIYLDSLSALAVKDAIQEHAQAGIKAIKQEKQQTSRSLKNNWTETHEAATAVGQALTASEIAEALATVKADENSIYNNLEEKLASKIKGISQLSQDFDDFSAKMTERINKRIGDDGELARNFGL
ncbi:lipase family protein [Lactobacillus sp. PV034]|uniref:lipase family protein n=1 Tax=Lactobacillus sp. PV034 TaxID=2594495 RepID=UPI00223F6B69|nr:hypothetical protein [Lactobacillus sp. PV034]